MKFKVAKGVKDWYGKDAILRNQVRTTLKTVFEKYGFAPIETPIIERKDTLSFKGGGEIQKEVFQLKDQGKRDLALRFDQTVPLARFVATNKEDIKMPFKRYAIGEVFRDGPTQPEQGRYRSFTQCDVDILGVKDMTAEAYLFSLAKDAFQELGLGDVEVKINNRKLLDGLLDYANVPDIAKLRTIVTLDKIDKIGKKGVEKELLELKLLNEDSEISNDTLNELFENYKKEGPDIIDNYDLRKKIINEVNLFGYKEIKNIFQSDLSLSYNELYEKIANYKTTGPLLLTKNNVKKITEIISLYGNNDKIYSNLEKMISSPTGEEGLREIKELLDYSKIMDFDFIKLDPCLARGLDYYTGTTIEVYLKDKSICKSAILAGGRFDNMVGDFRGEGLEIPAVGFSFGLERVVMVMKDYKKDLPVTNTNLYIIPIGETVDETLKIANYLRNNGLNIDIQLQKNKKIGQSISFANHLGIPYVALVGEDELKSKKLSIKNLKNGEQIQVDFNEVKNYILNK